MPSQIKVDEIKNVAGQYEIKTNTLKGQTTAGSVTVTGEGGTATFVLQQGLAKVWVNFDGTATFDGSDTEIRDSFNVASTIDNGTGNYDATFTNNMNDSNYSSTGTCAHDKPISANRDSNFQVVAESASQINLNIFSSSQQDRAHVCGQAFGDLA